MNAGRDGGYLDPPLHQQVLSDYRLSWTARGLMLAALDNDGWLGAQDLEPTPSPPEPDEGQHYESAADIAAAVQQLRARAMATLDATGTLLVLPPARWI